MSKELVKRHQITKSRDDVEEVAPRSISKSTKDEGRMKSDVEVKTEEDEEAATAAG